MKRVTVHRRDVSEAGLSIKVIWFFGSDDRDMLEQIANVLRQQGAIVSAVDNHWADWLYEEAPGDWHFATWGK